MLINKRMDKEIVAYPYNAIVQFFEKDKTKQNTDTRNHIDKSQNYYGKRKKPDARVCSVWFRLYDVHKQASFGGRDRKVVPWSVKSMELTDWEREEGNFLGCWRITVYLDLASAYQEV